MSGAFLSESVQARPRPFDTQGRPKWIIAVTLNVVWKLREFPRYGRAHPMVSK